MEPTGRIFDVSRCCVDDGPGLRTVVFLKGCGLRCPWCHNPEGRDPAPELSIDARRCIGCGACSSACPRGRPVRDGCTVCGACVPVCPSGARRMAGTTREVGDLVAEVLRDLAFFRGTGGGVTFSGGEPLLQAPFVLACARRLAEQGVPVAVETAGQWPSRLVPAVADAFDLVLYDVKHVSSDRLRGTVGADPRRVLGNLEALARTEVPIEVRLTIVPGFNDSDRDLAALAGYLRGLARPLPVRLQAFHRMAVAKHELFGRPCSCADVQPVTREALEGIAQRLAGEGIRVSG